MSLGTAPAVYFAVDPQGTVCGHRHNTPGAAMRCIRRQRGPTPLVPAYRDGWGIRRLTPNVVEILSEARAHALDSRS